jgi:hypothetical protein
MRGGGAMEMKGRRMVVRWRRRTDAWWYGGEEEREYIMVAGEFYLI